MIPPQVERRARWVLDSIGATEVGFGDDVPYVAEAWEQAERGELPDDDLAAGFFHLARVEERNGPRDEHGRFRAEWSRLDPLDPPLERLRKKLGLEDATFSVALTHDVDSPRRWTPVGVRGAASRLKRNVLAARPAQALREGMGLAAMPLHRLRGTDPNWRFREIAKGESARGASSSTYFLLMAHHDPHDGAAPEVYDALRPQLVETIAEAHGEIGLHGSYTAADDPRRLADERAKLEELLGGPFMGHRYHYLRGDPHRNIADLPFRYDTTLGFPDAVGFRAGIARPFHPWDFARDAPAEILEVPLAAMDATLAEERYLGLSAKRAEPRLTALLDWAAENGGAFAILWHPDRFDPLTSGGWDRLYWRVLEGVAERGGHCVSAGELSSHSTWSK